MYSIVYQDRSVSSFAGKCQKVVFIHKYMVSKQVYHWGPRPPQKARVYPESIIRHPKLVVLVSTH
jgi:hypothetical protein